MIKKYETNSYDEKLTTTITGSGQDATGFYVTLAETIIYPGGGGQPADWAFIDGLPVSEIVNVEEHTRYYLEGDLGNRHEAVITIDWTRRFDFMQQHTGQHILARAFENLLTANIGRTQFDEGDSYIEILGEKLTIEQLEPALELANQVIRAHPDVKIHFPKAENALAAYPTLLNKPHFFSGLRLIEISNFDTIACGGTHVDNASEVQLILLDAIKHNKKGTTVHFSCGQRALAKINLQQKLLADLTSKTNVLTTELAATFADLQQQKSQLQARLESYQAAELEHSFQLMGPGFIISQGQEVSGSVLKTVGTKLSELNPHHLICVFSVEAQQIRYHLHYLPKSTELQVGKLIRGVNQQFGGKGGGSPIMGDGTLPLAAQTAFLEYLGLQADQS